MHPIELDAILKLAKTHLRSGRVPEAEQMYVGVLKADPRCAEALHFLGLAAMHRGKLDDALNLVRRSLELEPQKPDYLNNLATVLGRMNRGPEALGAAQQAIDLKPDFPEAHSNKGVALEKLGRLPEAIDAYRNALALRPDYAEALANLGNALSHTGAHDEAAALLRKAADLRPRDASARKNLGNALRRAGRPLEAVTAYRMAVEINPRDADAHNNLGAALQESGKTADAEHALRTCLAINPNHPDAHWNLGLALLSLGRWREGWVEYEWRRHLREDAGQQRNFPQPVWQGSPLPGRHLLILCEQGLGDTIQFIRYVPKLVEMGARVTVECQPKLRPLLQCLQNQNVKVIARGEPLPNFDMHARLMTLPHILGSTPDDLPNVVPYLTVNETRIAHFAQLLSPPPSDPPQSATGNRQSQMNVGLVWQGNPAHKGDRFRSIPLNLFSPLATIPNVRWISLQKGPGSDQIALNPALNLLQWSDPTDTTAEALLDTAAVIKNLDLVITVDTSLAHLAGALGVPVWVAMPLAPDWRWLLDREDTPWYPTMRLFRQRHPNDWTDVIATLTESLTTLAAHPTLSPTTPAHPAAA